jgi:hypothetical protein
LDNLHQWVDADGPCWLWQGMLSVDGYGRMWQKTDHRYGRKIGAHRAVWELLVGVIPDGMQLDHLCRNRRCVNPDHLDPVTAAENVRRGFMAKLTNCLHGHPFTPENTYITASGRRSCRACKRRSMAEWRKRQEVAA